MEKEKIWARWRAPTPGAPGCVQNEVESEAEALTNQTERVRRPTKAPQRTIGGTPSPIEGLARSGKSRRLFDRIGGAECQ